MRNGHTEVSCPTCKAQPDRPCVYVDPKNWKDQAAWWRLPVWRQVQCLQRAGQPLDNNSTHYQREQDYRNMKAATIAAGYGMGQRSLFEVYGSRTGRFNINRAPLTWYSQKDYDDSVIAAYNAGKRLGYEEGRQSAINQIATGNYGG